MIYTFCFNRVATKQDKLKELWTIPETWGMRQEGDRQRMGIDLSCITH